ncbi:MAG: hypothetical protein AAGD11_20875 [Planctomycetota bacterium]
MNETFRKLVDVVAGNFLWVILGGTAAGVFYGFVTSLIDGNMFVEVLVVDGIAGFVASLFVALIALYLRFRLGSSVIYHSYTFGAQSLSADELELHRKLEKTIKARNYTLIAMPIVAITTALEYLDIFSPGYLPPWFGLVVLVACGIQTLFLNSKISKIKASISNPFF